MLGHSLHSGGSAAANNPRSLTAERGELGVSRAAGAARGALAVACSGSRLGLVAEDLFCCQWPVPQLPGEDELLGRRRAGMQFV